MTYSAQDLVTQIASKDVFHENECLMRHTTINLT